MIKYPPKYSVSWIAKRIKGRSSKLLRDRFSQLKEWRPGHLWAPSCYHKTFKKSFIKNASQSVGQGWEVVERYISGQKGYEKADTVPVVVIDEEKENLERTKHGTHRFMTNFLEGSIKNKKSKSFYNPVIKR